MQLALSTMFAPPSISVWDELSGNLRQGFTTRNRAWNPGPNVVNSTTAIGLQARLILEGVRQSHSARYYNPLTGRFMSRDPEDHSPTNPKELDTYLYTGGDPVNAIDPTGRDTIETIFSTTEISSPLEVGAELAARSIVEVLCVAAQLLKASVATIPVGIGLPGGIPRFSFTAIVWFCSRFAF